MPSRSQVESCFVAAGFLMGREGMGEVSRNLIELGKEVLEDLEKPAVDKRSERMETLPRVAGRFYASVPARIRGDYFPAVGDVVTEEIPAPAPLTVEGVSQGGYVKLSNGHERRFGELHLRRPALLQLTATNAEAGSFERFDVSIPSKLLLPGGLTLDLSAVDVSKAVVTATPEAAQEMAKALEEHREKTQSVSEGIVDEAASWASTAPPEDLYRAITGEELHQIAPAPATDEVKAEPQ